MHMLFFLLKRRHDSAKYSNMFSSDSWGSSDLVDGLTAFLWNNSKSNRKPVRSTVSLPQQSDRLSLVSTLAFRMFSRKVKVNGARQRLRRSFGLWRHVLRHTQTAHIEHEGLCKTCARVLSQECVCAYEWIRKWYLSVGGDKTKIKTRCGNAQGTNIARKLYMIISQYRKCGCSSLTKETITATLQ